MFCFFQTGKSLPVTKETTGVAPTGRMSAYSFFLDSCYEERLKKDFEEDESYFLEYSKKCVEKWMVGFGPIN